MSEEMRMVYQHKERIEKLEEWKKSHLGTRNKKIKQLEKGFDIMAKDHQKVVIDITKLEKIEIENQLSNIRVIADGREKHTIKELSELKKCLVLSEHDTKLYNIEKLDMEYLKRLEDQDKEIAELKERVDTNQIDRVKEHILIEEVLRELLIWFSECHTYADEVEMYKEYKERFTKLLAKLGGDTSVKEESALSQSSERLGSYVRDRSAGSTESQPPSLKEVQKVVEEFDKKWFPAEQDLCSHESHFISTKTRCEKCDAPLEQDIGFDPKKGFVHYKEVVEPELIKVINYEGSKMNSDEYILVEKAEFKFLISWANRGIMSMWNPKAPSPDIIPSKREFDKIKEKYLPEEK